LERLAQLAV
jgi:hypothetical protein